MCSFICPKFILIEILWAEHLFKRKSRLLFIYDDTPEGGGRGARGKFCRNEKDGRYTILNYKVDEPGKGGKIHFFTTASRSDDGGGEGGQKSNINLFLSKHQQIKGIKGVSEGGKGVAKLLFSGLGRA